MLSSNFPFYFQNCKKNNDHCCEPRSCKLKTHAQCSHFNYPGCCSETCYVSYISKSLKSVKNRERVYSYNGGRENLKAENARQKLPKESRHFLVLLQSLILMRWQKLSSISNNVFSFLVNKDLLKR